MNQGFHGLVSIGEINRRFDNGAMTPPLLAHLTNSPSIILSTLNAKYIHASLGLRYLLANMGDLRPHTLLREFTIARNPQEIADELLSALEGAEGVQVIGFGVYIWNVVQTAAVIRLLKRAKPHVRIVLGGPEVSHEYGEQEIVRLADHVITGWGDLSFAGLCNSLLYGIEPEAKIIHGEQPPLEQIALPYGEYSDADLANRLLYVEASRGCPFKCEFCLSALDKTAWSFDLDTFLGEMQVLYKRGARHFKFVDRTFNLKIEASVRILQFFLDRLDAPDASGDLFVHFEVVPDHLPLRLKEVITCFPPGVLQFEVGIQSFTEEVQQRISRRQDNEKTEVNVRWLMEESNAHLHTDLLFGLPGETLESFARGFDRLYALKPHEIQVGILKRLRGTPVVRHTIEYGMVYDPAPPYSIQQTSTVSAETMERFARFARYWDLVANSGRFKQTLPLLLEQAKGNLVVSPFNTFLEFSDWLWQRFARTSGWSPELLVDALFDYLCVEQGLPQTLVEQTLLNDYVTSGARGSPERLRGLLPKREVLAGGVHTLSQRQGRHMEVG